jgi:hypothetical protein
VATILLFLCVAALAGAQPDLPDDQNRGTLEALLQNRGIPYETRSSSLVITLEPRSDGGGLFILVVPLAYAGESPLDPAAPLPLRFSAALSLVEALQAGNGEDGGRTSMIVFPGKTPGGLEQGAELERALEDREAGADAALFYLDIPAGAEPGLVGFEGRPGLGYLRPIPLISDELNLVWSFDVPLFPLSGQFARHDEEGFRTLSRLAESGQFEQMNLMRLSPKDSAEDAKEMSASMLAYLPASMPGGETLGAFFYRYIRETGVETSREHNYLIVQAAGKRWFVSEQQLALSFLIVISFFTFGMLFLPRFSLYFLRRSPIPPGKAAFARERVVHVTAVVMLWLCLLVMAGSVFLHIGLYPFLLPALVLCFTSRSLRRPLLSGVLLVCAAAYLGLLAWLAFLPG